MWYDIASLLLIAFTHVYLFGVCINSEKISFIRMVLLSLALNFILIVGLGVTGYTELNVIILLLFLTIWGIVLKLHPLMHILFFAFASTVLITVIKNVIFLGIHKLYFILPFNYYVDTDNMLAFITLALMAAALLLGRRLVMRASNYVIHSRWFVPAFIVLVICTLLLLIVNAPTIQLLANVNAYYGETLYMTVLIVAIVFMMLIIVSMYRSKKHLIQKHEQERQQQLIEYVEKLEFLHDELATFRHDYSNLLLSLDTSIRANDLEQVKQIYEETIAPTANILNNQQLELTKLSRIQLPALKSVLSMKILTAQRKQLHVQVDIPHSISSVTVPMDDYIRMMSVLLDNAIEAATQSEEKLLQIALFEMDDCLYYIVQNTTQQENVQLEQLYTKRYSTKGSGRGYGLFSLQRLMQQHPHVMLSTEQCGRLFKQQLTVRNTKTVYEVRSTV